MLRLRVPIKQSDIVELKFFIHPNSLNVIEFILSLKEHLKQFKDLITIKFFSITKTDMFLKNLQASRFISTVCLSSGTIKFLKGFTTTVSL